jgi:hypothetical protein
MSTIAYAMMNHPVIVFISGDVNWADAEVQEYARYLEPFVKEAKAAGLPFKVLALGGKNGPSVTQRATIAAATANVNSQTAVVTEASVTRFLITAFSWLGLSIRAYAPSDIFAAASYLDMTIGQLDAALSMGSVLAKQLGEAPQLESTLRIAHAQLKR